MRGRRFSRTLLRVVARAGRRNPQRTATRFRARQERRGWSITLGGQVAAFDPFSPLRRCVRQSDVGRAGHERVRALPRQGRRRAWQRAGRRRSDVVRGGAPRVGRGPAGVAGSARRTSRRVAVISTPSPVLRAVHNRPRSDTPARRRFKARSAHSWRAGSIRTTWRCVAHRSRQGPRLPFDLVSTFLHHNDPQASRKRLEEERERERKAAEAAEAERRRLAAEQALRDKVRSVLRLSVTPPFPRSPLTPPSPLPLLRTGLALG